MDAEGKNERTLQDDPQYFGGYLNMARLNIFNISNHVADKLSIALLKNEEDRLLHTIIQRKLVSYL